VLSDWPPTPAAMAPLRNELESMLIRAFHVGAFICWAEARTAAGTSSPATALLHTALPCEDATMAPIRQSTASSS
jgi:hypothetical protein